MSRAVIYASARANGNTAKLLAYWRASASEDLIIDLTQRSILPFSYQQDTRSDDFMETIHTLIEIKHWLWVTPVYWYSMTTWHKLFLDRMTDLLTGNKALGRKLRGKSFSVLANSASETLPACFSQTFELTANYLGMTWLGAEHVPVMNDQIDALALPLAVNTLHEKYRGLR